jgi:hypothetical protein
MIDARPICARKPGPQETNGSGGSPPYGSHTRFL